MKTLHYDLKLVINSSLINVIRRIILADIPCFVFRTFPYSENKANIEINTARFNNEIIKQRLNSYSD